MHFQNIANITIKGMITNFFNFLKNFTAQTSSHKQKEIQSNVVLKIVKINNQYLIAVPFTLTINIEPVSPNVP